MREPKNSTRKLKFKLEKTNKNTQGFDPALIIRKGRSKNNGCDAPVKA